MFFPIMSSTSITSIASSTTSCTTVIAGPKLIDALRSPKKASLGLAEAASVGGGNGIESQIILSNTLVMRVFSLSQLPLSMCPASASASILFRFVRAPPSVQSRLPRTCASVPAIPYHLDNFASATPAWSGFLAVEAMVPCSMHRDFCRPAKSPHRDAA
ncbi:hypothetical protein EDB81DRAFT_408706 [Dactylonectria macrodidyma]|uniref:Uncharacterized protein n=1 Tax=Dactylonectria macrodidyma TaxID=307937 RepID=A0A9P9FA77_9HYPO|nr:hypothetical protein EDB81DRAFT_408706 [Dactylonectria macrodidyma]